MDRHGEEYERAGDGGKARTRCCDLHAIHKNDEEHLLHLDDHWMRCSDTDQHRQLVGRSLLIVLVQNDAVVSVRELVLLGLCYHLIHFRRRNILFSLDQLSQRLAATSSIPG